MKTRSKEQGFYVSFDNPYETTTVKSFLEEKLLIPRKIRHFLRVKKHIWINQEPINWQSPIAKGDTVTLFFDQEAYPAKTIHFGNPDLVDCLYEDEHLIIVNKPEGMKTHGNQPEELALLNHVSAYIGQTAYVVHRLDMETSGVILFAKNPFILPILNRLLENRDIHRDYWALVQGSFDKKEMTFRDPIGRHRHDRRKRLVDPKQGQRAITEVRVLKTFASSSLINCKLKTGRTHQIRVHLTHHKHPLLGDPLYYPSSPVKRLMLHAHQLSFRHPLTNQDLCIKAKSNSFEAILANETALKK